VRGVISRTGIRNDAWTDMELQELYEVVNDSDWFAKVALRIHRTEKAIRAKMCALRREAGIVAKPGPTARAVCMTERQRATDGCDRLKAALLDMVA
jgi:hypothetical protein